MFPPCLVLPAIQGSVNLEYPPTARRKGHASIQGILDDRLEECLQQHGNNLRGDQDTNNQEEEQYHCN